MDESRPYATPTSPGLVLMKDMCPTTGQDREFLRHENERINYRMAYNSADLQSYGYVKGPGIQLGNDMVVPSTGVGTSFAELKGCLGEMANVLHVPTLGRTLLSPGQSTGTGIKFWFDGDRCVLYAKDGCCPPTLNQNSMQHVPAAFRRSTTSWLTWHKRLTHLHHRGMKYLQNGPAIEMSIAGQVHPIAMDNCEDCIMGKMTRFPFTTSCTSITRPGELIYSDSEGPFPTRAWQQNHCIMSHIWITSRRRPLFTSFVRNLISLPPSSCSIAKSFAKQERTSTRLKPYKVTMMGCTCPTNANNIITTGTYGIRPL